MNTYFFELVFDIFICLLRTLMIFLIFNSLMSHEKSDSTNFLQLPYPQLYNLWAKHLQTLKNKWRFSKAAYFCREIET